MKSHLSLIFINETDFVIVHIMYYIIKMTFKLNIAIVEIVILKDNIDLFSKLVNSGF